MLEYITLEQWLQFIGGLGLIILCFFILPPIIDNWEEKHAR